jgi:hypothetical protein
MSKPPTFTRHAEQKFVDLAELGFAVTREQVIETVQMPDYVDHVVDPPIAQKGLDDRHLLRVVFVEEAETIRIVTFYPARRVRYEP